MHSFRCWDESPSVQAWALSQGLRNSSDIRNYFQKRLQLIAQKRGASAVFWQEVYDARYELLSSSVIDIWLDNARFADVLRAGHRAVQSFGYYLDRQIPGNPNRTHYFWQGPMGLAPWALTARAMTPCAPSCPPRHDQGLLPPRPPARLRPDA